MKTGRTAKKSLGRAANWIVALASVALISVSVGGYFYHREQLTAIAAEHLRLIVAGPAALRAGAPAEYLVRTTAISGQPLQAQIEITLFGSNGRRLKAYKEVADEHGRLRIVVPADLELPDRVFLEIVARHDENREEMRMPLPVERAADAPPKNAPAQPRNSQKINVVFRPEGGALAPGLENRVYFSACDSQNKPLDLSAAVVVRDRDAGADVFVSAAQTMIDGLGAFSLTPFPGETYRLKITIPKDVAGEPTLPEVLPGRNVVLTTGAGVFPSEKPLEFNIRAAKANCPLIVAAYSDGLQIGQHLLVAKTGANAAAIDLDDAVCGPILLAVFDYGQSPPKPAGRRWVYRRPPKKQSDDAATKAISRLADVLENAEMPPDAKFYLSDGVRGKIPAAVALDLLLGARGRTNPDCRPPAVFDNLGQIQSNYEKTLTDYQAERTQALNTLTTTSFFGGLGLVLFVAMLGLMRVVSGLHLWFAAVGAAACCLIVGAILIDPARLNAEREPTVQFQTNIQNDR